MPTLKQQRAVNLVETGRTLGEVMVKAGYSKNTSIAPTKLTKSKGFKELCKKFGLTDKLLTTALVEDIKKKPQNRKAEIELGYKVIGRLKDVEEGDKNLTINVVNYGNNDTTPLRAERLPTTLLTEPKEIQNLNSPQEGWKIKDGIERTDKEVSKA
jgi:hypothetical protein